MRGETTGFAHTADLSPEGLRARGRGGGGRGAGRRRRDRRPSRCASPTTIRSTTSVVLPETVEKRRKVELLARADAAARETGDAVTSVTASYADARRRILVANSDGLLADDDRCARACRCRCVATGDTGMQTAHEAPGRTMGFELFDTFAPEDVGRSAARRARSRCSTRCPRPSGRLPVVLKRGAGGVLFHEACGHGLEADHILKDASVFKGQIGESVASPLVTHRRRRRSTRASGARSRSTTKATPRSATC